MSTAEPTESTGEQDVVVRTFRSGVGYVGAFTVVFGGVALGTLSKLGLSEEATRSLQDGHARRTQTLVRWSDANGTRAIVLAETGVRVLTDTVRTAKPW